MLNIWVSCCVAMVCGFAMPFAFSPFDDVWLALLGLSGWLWLLQQQPQHSLKLGLAFGFGWFGLGAWWLADTFNIYGHVPYGFALLAVVVLGLLLGCFMAFWAWLVVKLQQRPMDILWLFPCVGVLEEWLRSFLFTGFPWTALGNLIIYTPASPWVSVFGGYFATLLGLWLVAASVLALQVNTRKQGAVALGFGLLFFVVTPSLETAVASQQEVALVQPNIPQNHKWDAQFLQDTMLRLVSLSEQAGDVDLIIWPEAAVPMYLSRAPAWDDWLTKKMELWETDVAFGGIQLLEKDEYGQQKSQNGLFLHQHGEETRQFVGKHHLVPFGEYVPAWLPWLGKLVPDIGDFVPAEDAGILHSGAHKLGILICYESIFAEQASSRIEQGADVFIVVTNDAWYDQSPAAWQHLQAAQMRALETGRYVLRAANTGVTAIIAPDGRIQASLPWWQAGVLRGSYQSLTHLTPYQQWGNIPILTLIFLGLGWGVYRMFEQRQGSRG